MKTGKEFYEMHHPLDVGIETKDGCIKMMEQYANYVLGIAKNLQQPAVISSFCKCKGGAVGRTVTSDFEHQICDKCGKLAK